MFHFVRVRAAFQPHVTNDLYFKYLFFNSRRILTNHQMKDQSKLLGHLEQVEVKGELVNQDVREKLDLQDGQDNLEFQDHLVNLDRNQTSSHFWNKSRRLKVAKKDLHLTHFLTCKHRLDQ